MRWMGHIVYRGKTRNAYEILVRKPQERDNFGELIKMDLKKKIGYKDVKLVKVAQERSSGGFL
jgi:hypothetical protein